MVSYFYWFKEFEMAKFVGMSCRSKVEFIKDWDYQVHSLENKTELLNLFKEVGCELPSIPKEIYKEEPEKYVSEKLNNPSVMAEKCQELLDGGLLLGNLVEQIIWIKELSDKGYYIMYGEI